jgi:thiol-disulfide isomerase/thioredoxin
MDRKQSVPMVESHKLSDGVVQVFDKIDTINASIIGLYFSGEYCHYCKEFSAMLIDSYPKLRANKIDIIYVSSDKTIEQYESVCWTQPWHALAYGDTDLRMNLRQQFDIKTIPALLFFDVARCTLLEANGRALIQADPSKAIQVLTRSLISDYDSDDSDF